MDGWHWNSLTSRSEQMCFKFGVMVQSEGMFALLVKIDLALEPNLQDFIILLSDKLLA